MNPCLRLPDGQLVPVRDGMVIGRVKCDVVIEDTKASRRHARIISEAGVIEVEDLGSSNGTFLNGKQIDRKVMRMGDAIQIGRTVIMLEEGAAAAAAAPVPAHTANDDVDLFGDDDEEAIEAPSTPAPRAAPAESAPPDPGLLDDEDGKGDEDDEDDDFDLLAGFEPSEPPPKAINPTPVRVSVPPPGVPDRVAKVVEFEDEVVEIRARPATESGRGSGRAATASGGDHELVSVRKDVLQFNKKGGGSGVLGDDLAQMGGIQKLLVVLLAIGAAVGLGYLAMQLAS